MKIAKWRDIPPPLRSHLYERIKDRSITASDLHRLQFWVESCPDVPEGEWWKDFGTFKLCGEGPNPKTFLTSDQIAWGAEVF